MKENKDRKHLSTKRPSRYAIFTNRTTMNRVPHKSKKPKRLRLKKGVKSKAKPKPKQESILSTRKYKFTNKKVKDEGRRVSLNNSPASAISSKKSALNFKERTVRLHRQVNDSSMTIKIDASDMMAGIPAVRRPTSTSRRPHVNNLEYSNDILDYSNRMLARPPPMPNLDTIIYLNLSNNKLRNASFNFLSQTKKFEKMKILNLSHNQIPSLPTLFYTSFSNVSDMDISFNKINELSMGILMMKKLRVLDLTGNLMKVLPTYLKFIKLETLYMEWGPHSDFNFSRKKKDGRNGRDSYIRKNLFDKRGCPVDLKILRKVIRDCEERKLKEVSFFDYVKVKKPEDDFESLDNLHMITKIAIFRKHTGFVLKNLEVFPKLLQYKLGINSENILDIAITNKDKYIISFAINRKNAAEELRDWIDAGGSSLFAVKSKFLCTQFYNFLFVHGLDPNQSDQFGKSVMHYIMTKFENDKIAFGTLADICIEHGANPNQRDSRGITPLIDGIIKNQMDAISYAITWNYKMRRSKRYDKKFFDLNVEFSKLKLRPLHLASMIPSLSMLYDICEDPTTQILALDANLKLPSHHIKQGYLTSKKMMSRYENKLLKKKFFARAIRTSVANELVGDEINIVKNPPPSLRRHMSPGSMLEVISARTKRQLSVKELRLDDNNHDFASFNLKLEEGVSAANVPGSVTARDDGRPLKIISPLDHRIRSTKTKTLGGIKNAFRRNGGMVTRNLHNNINQDNLSSKSMEKFLELLNSQMSTYIGDFNRIFNNIFYALNSKKISKANSKLEKPTVVFDTYKFKELWKLTTLITNSLRIYQAAVKTNVNFPNGSNKYRSVKLVIDYYLKLINLIKRKGSTELSCSFVFRSCVDNYTMLAQEIKKIESLMGDVEKGTSKHLKALFFDYQDQIKIRDVKKSENKMMNFKEGILEMLKITTKQQKKRMSSTMNLLYSQKTTKELLNRRKLRRGKHRVGSQNDNRIHYNVDPYLAEEKFFSSNPNVQLDRNSMYQRQRTMTLGDDLSEDKSIYYRSMHRPKPTPGSMLIRAPSHRIKTSRHGIFD